jgi:hypothetical protein
MQPFQPQALRTKSVDTDLIQAELKNFANEYSETVFPQQDKFWVRGDSDLLKHLNARGAQQ